MADFHQPETVATLHCLRRERLAEMAEHGQKPEIMIVACCDSRVSPEVIFDARPGELFVVRNVANLVPRADSGDDSVGAAIEYCLDHLGVDDIVVCGHTGCAGIAAAR